MPRTVNPNKEKKSEIISAKVPPSLKEEILEIASQEDRTESWLVYQLVCLALPLYKQQKLGEQKASIEPDLAASMCQPKKVKKSNK